LNPSTALLISAFLHASWNAVVKHSKDPELALLRILGTATGIAVVSAALIETFRAPQIFLLWAIGAGLFEAGYMYSLAKALAKSGLGMSYAVMRGGAMILVWLFALLVLGQKIGKTELIGSVFILAGLALVTGKKDSGQTAKQYNWAYFAAACIAGYHLCYGKALAAQNQPYFLFAISLIVSVPIFIFLSKRKLFELIKFEHRADFVSGVGGGILCAASFLIFLVGLKNSGAGLAISLRNTSIIFAQLYAVILGERPSLVQWIGLATISLGAVMLV